MAKSLRRFLENLVDYAGLFPPARRPLEQALANYYRHSTSVFRWMLARFVCPATSLEKALRLWTEMEPELPLRLTVLWQADHAVELASQLEMATEAASHSTADLELLEGALPEEFYDSPQRWITILQSARRSHQLSRVDTFLEAPVRVWENLAPVLASAQQQQPGKLGLKLRCGGLVAEAFPSVESVASALRICVKHQIPFKATAGLHHPIRHLDGDLGVEAHGFVNLFAAGMLAAARDLSLKLLEECLQETWAGAFVFSDQAFQWNGHRISAAEIADLRSRLFISLGSCSFMEPLEDLATLGWLDLHQAPGQPAKGLE